MMNAEQRAYFEHLLTQWLAELELGRENGADGFSRMQEESPDFVDQASIESDRDFSFRIKERESKLILKIKDALKRLEHETFGVCEACGKGIAMARLKARPVTTLCIRCKKKQEMSEKARGL